MGIGDATPDGTLKLDVEGQIGATQYCDQNGANCTNAADLGGGEGGGASAMADLTDVDLTGIVDNKILKYSGGNWVVADDGGGSGSGQWDTVANGVNYSGGNVGIGATNPFRALTIAGNPGGVLGEGISILHTGEGGREYALLSTDIDNPTGPGNFNIYDDTANEVRFTLDQNGHVGIGTTTPAYALDVAGTIGINGTPMLYLPDQTVFTASLVVGDGGRNLTHTTGYEGIGNTFIGIGAGLSTTTGVANTGIGPDALGLNTTGNYNTAIGYNALWNNTSGAENTAIGLNSLVFNTTGKYGTAIGNNALYHNTEGESNTAVGRAALALNTTGGNNTAIGTQSLYYNTTGRENTATGLEALFSNTTGMQNSAFGLAALHKNTEGDSNAALGHYSLQNNITGSYNTASGGGALLNMTSGDSNTASGHGALENMTSGDYNTALGGMAGKLYGYSTDALLTANNSLFLGGNSRAEADGQTNQIVIGYGAVGIGSNTVVLGNNAITTTSLRGDVGIKNNSPSYDLDVTGDIRYTGNIYNFSDARFKKDIFTLASPLEILGQLRGVRYEYRTEEFPEKDFPAGENFGLIAQEVEAVLPQAVATDDSGEKSVDYLEFIPVLIEAVKAQQAIIDDQQSQIDELRSLIEQ